MIGRRGSIFYSRPNDLDVSCRNGRIHPGLLER